MAHMLSRGQRTCREGGVQKGWGCGGIPPGEKNECLKWPILAEMTKTGIYYHFHCQQREDIPPVVLRGWSGYECNHFIVRNAIKQLRYNGFPYTAFFRKNK